MESIRSRLKSILIFPILLASIGTSGCGVSNNELYQRIRAAVKNVELIELKFRKGHLGLCVFANFHVKVDNKIFNITRRKIFSTRTGNLSLRERQLGYKWEKFRSISDWFESNTMIVDENLSSLMASTLTFSKRCMNKDYEMNVIAELSPAWITYDSLTGEIIAIIGVSESDLYYFAGGL